MGTQYFCHTERRRQAVREHATLNGIDYLEVLDLDAPSGSPRQQTLLVRCLKPLPANLTAQNILIEGGVRITSINVDWASRAADAETLLAENKINVAERDLFLDQPETDHLLVIRTAAAGDFSPYRLCLVRSPTNLEQPEDFDPILSCLGFLFKVECPSDFDCRVAPACLPPFQPEPLIDYLAKDYASFRQLMLDRLAVIMPGWQERNPADLGIALVEILAYAADHLSYYQDAVATETYLGTARRRVSVRRHARLLDYPMHDGCNARAWVQVQVDAGSLPLPQEGTALLTRLVGQPARIAPNSDNEAQAMTQRPLVFRPLHSATLFPAHNNLPLYTWGDEECCLPKGATRATLAGEFSNLEAGDVLIFEERLDPQTGRPEDADPAHRHAVRLSGVTLSHDPLGGRFLDDPPTDNAIPVTEIEWPAADALPFPVCISTLVNGELVTDITVALGNIVLAGHGRLVENEPLEKVPQDGRYRPRLQETNITQCVPYEHDQARKAPAAAAIAQDPRQALPDVELRQNGTVWRPQRDLLSSDRFEPEFVVEIENDGGATLRFGDGKTFGRKPPGGAILEAAYGVGNGAPGNVGAESIAHVVTDEGGVSAVRNPMPAQGGTDPESLEEVRHFAPQAFRTQERAVTEADYAAVVQRHREVQRAAATRRWTGSWYTIFVTIDRLGGQPVDADFELKIRSFVERFRMAGHDLEIDAPRFVPLDIVMTVCVADGYFRSEVKRALLDVFSSRDLPDGRRGFFHPDNFTFGQPVYLSQVVATAMEVPGVLWIDVDNKQGKPNRFQRLGELARDEIEKGLIELERLEIARLNLDPSAPENGRLEFHMEGGL